MLRSTPVESVPKKKWIKLLHSLIGGSELTTVTIGRVVPEIFSWTDKHADRQTETVITIGLLRRPTGSEVKILKQ